MRNYSLRKNLRYMAMAFYKPRSLLDGFLGESSLLYGILPLIIFTLFYEFSYVLDYLFFQSPFANPFPKVLPIPDSQYRLYQIFFSPVVHIADFFIFGLVIYAISKLLRLYKFDTLKVVLFFTFIWNTIGLLAFVVDLVNLLFFEWKSWFLPFIHPITVVIMTLYLVEFIHKQAEINRWKSLGLFMAGLVVFLGFRIMFFR